jgi:hypothetical protein
MVTEIHKPGQYCPDRRDEIIEYVFDELGPGATEAFVAHLASCEGCRQETEELRETVGLIEEASPASAGAEASANGDGITLEEEWALLRRRLRFPENLAPEQEVTRRRSRMRVWMPAAAAVALTAALSFSAGYLWRGDDVEVMGEETLARAADAAAPPLSRASAGNYFDNLQDFTRDTHNCLRRTRMILMEFTNLGADSDPTFFREAAGELLSEVEQYHAVAARMENRKLSDLLDQIAGILTAISEMDQANKVQVIADVKAMLDLTDLVSTLELLHAAVERGLEGQPNA